MRLPSIPLFIPAVSLQDVAVPVAVRALGLALQIGLYLSAGVIVAEGILLHMLDRSRSWRAAFVASLAMNVASTLFGIALALTRRFNEVFWRLDVRGTRTLLDRSDTLSRPADYANWFLVFGILCLISTVVEAIVLCFFRRDRPQRYSVRDSVVVNLFSYTLLAIGLLAFAPRS